MPTKIHIRKLPSHRDHHHQSNHDSGGNLPTLSTSFLQNLNSTPQQQQRPSFFPASTSILQMSVRSSTDDNNHHNNNATTTTTTERKVDDIRGSPRLTGYIFNMIAAAVMIISDLE
jgi:hypothetical protein